MPFPGTQAGDDASPDEWEDEDSHGDDCKFEGMRNAARQKHGIVRTIIKNGSINEATYCEDKKHGLSFYWWDNSDTPFVASIYDHGERKALIWWNKDWSEDMSTGNKELILENNGLSIFKP